MSTLRTQKVTPLDGETNLILGDSGDTVTIPAGVTLAGSGASLTNLAAHTGNVAFPATQVASADANTLDDYEEGTWTPVVGGAGGTSGQSYSAQIGRYTKIGSAVYCRFMVALTTLGTVSGNAEIQGLPFAINSSTSNRGGGGMTDWYLLNTAQAFLSLFPFESSSKAIVRGTVTANVSSSSRSSSIWGNATNLTGWVFYQV
jgi:hypothetical protein